MAATEQTIKQVNKLGNSDYKYGFSTDIEEIKPPKGLNEEIVKFISAQKNEPNRLERMFVNVLEGAS